jgi:acyl-CoA synthetase (AMP-forming)/AMP-acid ligase II
MRPASVPPGPGYRETLPEVIRWAAATHGDMELFVSDDCRLSFRDAERQSAALARGLLALGVGKGTRIGILMENAPDWPLCFFAAARAGALAVSLSTFYQAAELSWGLRHNDIDTLLISARYLRADYLDRLERAVPGLADQDSTELHLPSHPFLRRIIVWGECDRAWAMKGPEALLAAAASKPAIDEAFLEAVESNIVPADDLVIICTSGSTAEPKAVLHTHGTCVRATHEYVDHWDMKHGDRTYSGQPFFWISGINVNLMTCLYVGATLCFSPSPRVEDILDLIEREKITRLSLWPAQLHGILAQAEGRDLSTVRAGNGRPTDAFGQLIPADRLMGGVMGMTECFGMHSIDPIFLPTPIGKGGHWGRHLRGFERIVIDRETGQSLPAGQEGELYIRGYSLMRGYYKKEREEVFTKDGWFATGDLVVIDEDDYIYFTGRLTELIKTAGANVAPREVELAIQRYPGVREAIVFGLPDPIKGEKVVAVLVARDGETVEPDEIARRLRDDISPYKVPAHIVMMGFEEVPRTGSHKPQKPQLKQLISVQLGDS